VLIIGKYRDSRTRHHNQRAIEKEKEEEEEKRKRERKRKRGKGKGENPRQVMKKLQIANRGRRIMTEQRQHRAGASSPHRHPRSGRGHGVASIYTLENACYRLLTNVDEGLFVLIII